MEELQGINEEQVNETGNQSETQTGSVKPPIEQTEEQSAVATSDDQVEVPTTESNQSETQVEYAPLVEDADVPSEGAPVTDPGTTVSEEETPKVEPEQSTDKAKESVEDKEEPVAIADMVSNAVMKESTEEVEQKATEVITAPEKAAPDETSAVEEPKTEIIGEIDKTEDYDENDISNFLEEDEAAEEEEEKVDYTVFSKEELVNILADKLENAPIQDIKYDVDSIKSNFYKKRKAEIDAARKIFITEGGDPAEFVVEPEALEDRLKDLLNEYRRLRTEYTKNIELEKEANLRKKYEIIESIKELINGQESINKTFNDFRELQTKWREIGLVPQTEVRNLWENYHHNVEQFYDFIKINRELRDLDLKRNLQSKVKLCEQAEELMMEPSVVKAFKQLQVLHDQWREIGPVPQEQREDIWERFKRATSSINKTHQEYFDKLKQEQSNNLNAKIALCEKVEEIANFEYPKHKEWEMKSDELIEVQKLWKTIGFATKKENNKVFERFRAACDMFFNKKRDFYFEHREVQNNNMQLKTDLCIQAEGIKDSTDWKKTTNELIKLQKDWKEIGPVPRKHSDAIWKRFRAACNEFFDNKKKHFSSIDKEYSENLKAKEELIDKVKNFTQAENIEENINLLKGYQKEWTEIGHVPFKVKDRIQKEFREAVNAQFDKMKIDSDKRSVLVYKQRLESMSQSNKGGNRQYRVEKDRILDNIRQLQSDIVLLENNIGFFAKTKNAEALIKDVNQKIERAKRKIKTEKQKLDLINKIE